MNSLIIDGHDGLLITWILNWNINALLSGPSGWANFLNANIFFPYHTTLAFSDLHMTGSLLALPFVVFFQEPLLAFNLNFLLGFILTGFSIYLLARELTKDLKMSVFAAILFSFSIIHLNYMAHLQLFDFWPVVLTLLFLIQRKYLSFVVSFLLAVVTSPLNFYFLFCVALVKWLRDKIERGNIVLWQSVAAFGSLFFLVPYLVVSKQFNYVRPINDAVHFSLQLPQLMNISSVSRLSSFIPPTSAGTPAYFGAVFVILAVIMVFKLLKNRKIKKLKNPNLKYFLLLAAVSLVLALGPALHILSNTVHIGPFKAIPLPYALFYYIVPGFSGFRTPSRWILLTALALVCALAIYFKYKFSTKSLIILSLLVLLEINFPFKYTQVPSVKNFPPEQIWLAKHYIGESIIQFPIYSWDNPEFGTETMREYYSTIHWHPMYNGYSGFSPKEWETKVKWLQKDFPSQESIKFLRGINIKLVLIPRSWSDNIDQYSQLQLVQSFKETNIYKLNQ